MFTFFFFALLVSFFIHRYDPKYKLVRPAHEFYLNKIRFNNKVNRASFSRMDSFLSDNVQFYKNLSLEGRAKFIHRLELFIETKRFRPMNEFELKEHHKWLLGSGAIIITYGLDDFLYPNIKEIWVYPREFYLSLIGKTIKGGATKHRVMLSWNNLEQGFTDASDALNLSIHEFTHAFELHIKHSRKTDRRYQAYLEVLSDIKSEAFEKFKTSDSALLRAYGKTNRHEFFAVTMEHFIENPKKLLKGFPNLFVHLCVAFNLNPLARNEDYRLTEEFIEASNRDSSTEYISLSVSKFVLDDSYKWPQLAILFGFFLGLPASGLLYSTFHVKPISFLLMWLSASMAVVAFGYGKYIRSKYMVGFTFIMYSVTGLAPLIMVLFMIPNFFWVREMHMDHKWTEIEAINYNTGAMQLSKVPNFSFDNTKFNPIRMNPNQVKKLDVQRYDSLKVRFISEHHLPGWINITEIRPMEYKGYE